MLLGGGDRMKLSKCDELLASVGSISSTLQRYQCNYSIVPIHSRCNVLIFCFSKTSQIQCFHCFTLSYSLTVSCISKNTPRVSSTAVRQVTDLPAILMGCSWVSPVPLGKCYSFIARTIYTFTYTHIPNLESR